MEKYFKILHEDVVLKYYTNSLHSPCSICGRFNVHREISFDDFCSKYFHYIFITSYVLIPCSMIRNRNFKYWTKWILFSLLTYFCSLNEINTRRVTQIEVTCWWLCVTRVCQVRNVYYFINNSTNTSGETS